MSDLLPAVFRQHFETDLVDDALQRLIDDAEEDVRSVAGASTAAVDDLAGDNCAMLWLKQTAESITSVVERVGTVETTLSANDYQFRYGSKALERLADGDNPRNTWGPVVTVTYEPALTSAKRRTRVTIDLVKLSIQFQGLHSLKSGDVMSTFAYTPDAYKKQRDSILASLSASKRGYA